MTRFATIESRINSAVVSHLSNVTATIGASSVDGIFTARPADAFGVVQNADPRFSALTADLTAATVGASIVIDGTTYTVAAVNADGTGMTELMLR